MNCPTTKTNDNKNPGTTQKEERQRVWNYEWTGSTLSGCPECATVSAQQRLLFSHRKKMVQVVPFFFSDLLEPPNTPSRLPPIWGRGDSGLPVGPDGPKSEIETEILLDQFFFPCPLALNWCPQTWTNKWCLAVLPVQWTAKMQQNTIATDSKDIPHTVL